MQETGNTHSVEIDALQLSHDSLDSVSVSLMSDTLLSGDGRTVSLKFESVEAS
jgi:hypothetical protein